MTRGLMWIAVRAAAIAGGRFGRSGPSLPTRSARVGVLIAPGARQIPPAETGGGRIRPDGSPEPGCRRPPRQQGRSGRMCASSPIVIAATSSATGPQLTNGRAPTLMLDPLSTQKGGRISHPSPASVRLNARPAAAGRGVPPPRAPGRRRCRGRRLACAPPGCAGPRGWGPGPGGQSAGRHQVRVRSGCGRVPRRRSCLRADLAGLALGASLAHRHLQPVVIVSEPEVLGARPA